MRLLGLLIDLVFVVWWLVCSLMEVGVMRADGLTDCSSCRVSLDLLKLTANVVRITEQLLTLGRRVAQLKLEVDRITDSLRDE